MVEIGINPITWTNDDMPELGGDIPLETCLAEARLAGFSGIEMGGKFPRAASTLAPILARHDLKLVSGWYSAQLARRSADDEARAVEAHLSLLAAMGCRVMVFAEGHGSTDGDPNAALSQRPILAERDWPPFASRLRDLAKRMRARGVRLAFHHHMGTVVQTEVEIDRLMASTSDDVGLLRAVLDGIFTVPGDGSIDFAAVLSELRPAAYSGWIVVEAEQDPAKAYPLTYAKMGFANLCNAARDAGVDLALR